MSLLLLLSERMKISADSSLHCTGERRFEPDSVADQRCQLVTVLPSYKATQEGAGWCSATRTQCNYCWLTRPSAAAPAAAASALSARMFPMTLVQGGHWVSWLPSAALLPASQSCMSRLESHACVQLALHHSSQAYLQRSANAF